MSEHDEQKAVIDWCNQYARLRWHIEVNGNFPIAAIPNGINCSGRTGKKYNDEGRSKGFPDLEIPICRGDFCGLIIEMKYGKNKLTADQKGWIEFLSSQKRKTCVCYSAAEAIKEITVYMELGTP